MGRNEIVAGTVSPSYISPLQGLQRLEKIMDEYCGGIATHYMTNEPMLDRGLELLGMLHEDLDRIGAEDLHQLQRTWELHHRVWASESVTHHTKFREETRWPGYYYRGDHPKLDDGDWHVFTLGRYNPDSGDWEMEKAAGASPHRRLIRIGSREKPLARLAGERPQQARTTVRDEALRPSYAVLNGLTRD